MNTGKTKKHSAERRLGGLGKASWSSNTGANRVPSLALKLVTELKQENIEVDYVEVHPGGLIRAGKYPSGYQLPAPAAQVPSVSSKDDLWDRWASKL